MATSSKITRTCILHIGHPTMDEIKPFDNKSWEKVLTVKRVRVSKLSTSSKYSPVCISLPKDYNDNIGYHTSCYKNFTAIPKGKESTVDANTVPPEQLSDKVLRSQVHHQEKTSSGVFQASCIFCNHERKTVNRKVELIGGCETKEAEQAVKDAAGILQDTCLLTKIGQIDFIAKEVKYHHTCRKSYINRAQRAMKSADDKTDYGMSRDSHNTAFEIIADYVKENVIKNNRAETMTSIHARYLSIMDDLGVDCTTYGVQSLVEKVLNHFGTDVSLAKSSKKKGNVLYNSTMDKDQAIKSAHQYASSFECKVTDVALHIRAAIQQLRKNCKDLPSPLTAEALHKGQAEPPDVLLQFYRVLYTGSEKVSTHPRVERYIESASQDVIYATTRGKIKPAKHLCLGLGLKSMTGSRKVGTDMANEEEDETEYCSSSDESDSDSD